MSETAFVVLFWGILLLGFVLRHWGGLKDNKELQLLTEEDRQEPAAVDALRPGVEKLRERIKRWGDKWDDKEAGT